MRLLLQYSFDLIIAIIAQLVRQVALAGLTIYVLVNRRSSSVCEQGFVVKVVILFVAEPVPKPRSLIEKPLVIHHVSDRRLSLSERNFLRNVTILISLVFALSQTGLLPTPVSFVLLS